MVIRKNNLLISFTLGLSLILSACSSISRNVDTHKTVDDTNGLVKVKTKDNTVLVFERPGFKIGDYSKFYIAKVRTIITKENPNPLPPEDKLELEEYLRETIKRELTEGGYEVVEISGPDVIGMQFTFTDVDSGNPYLNVLQFYGPGIALDVGGITIETKFFDTMNYETQGIAVIGGDGARKFSHSSVMGKWGDVKKIFDDWAEGFRILLDKTHKAQ